MRGNIKSRLFLILIKSHMPLRPQVTQKIISNRISSWGGLISFATKSFKSTLHEVSLRSDDITFRFFENKSNYIWGSWGKFRSSFNRKYFKNFRKTNLKTFKSRLFLTALLIADHPTSYNIRTGGSFQGVKRQGREADHSPPTSAEVKKMWIYTSTPPYVFMA
jgi:hypothetical protein